MNSPGFQARYYTAFNDFEAALELAKAESKINTNRDIITHYVNQFDIEDQKFTNLSSLFNYIVKNFLVQNLPVSLEFKLKYYPKYHTVPEALNLAAFNQDMDFIKSVKFNQRFYIDTINTFLTLGGQKLEESGIKFFKEATVFLDERGLIDKVDTTYLRFGDKIPCFFHFAKNWLWDRIYDEYSTLKPSLIPEFHQEIVFGILASRRKGILQNPPDELGKIGITSEDYMKIIKSYRVNYTFPFNLCTKRQVEFFADDIRKIGFTAVERNAWRYVTNYATLKALSDVFGKKFVHPMRKKLMWRQLGDINPILDFTTELPIHKELKIAKYYGFTPQEYLTNRIQTIHVRLYLFLHYVKEYLRRGYPKEKIRDELNKYYKNFQEDKFRIE